MAESKYTLEKILRVYNDRTGEYLEVREDRDSLGLVEITQGERAMVMTVEEADLLIRAISEVSAHLRARGLG